MTKTMAMHDSECNLFVFYNNIDLVNTHTKYTLNQMFNAILI